MSYKYTNKRIEELIKKVVPYRAKSAEEDRGDTFIVGTPDYILEYENEINDYFNEGTTDSNGNPLM